MSTAEWHEVCLICGIAHTPESFLSDDPVADIISELPALLPPSFLTPGGNIVEASKIEERLTTAMKICKLILARSTDFFMERVLVGHFYPSYKYDVPWRLFRLRDTPSDTPLLTRQVLAGRGVQIRECYGEQREGDFELTEDDEQKLAALPDDPRDIRLHDEYLLNYLIHPPESMAGFNQSEDYTLKTSSAPNSYIPSCNNVSMWEGFGNFWVNKGCYAFLKAWVCLPPVKNRIYASKGEDPLSFEEEFYEVVNSRKHGRKSGFGTLIEMEYEGIPCTPFERSEFSIESPTPIAVAGVLTRKGDDSELVRAILRDVGYFVHYDPQVWPTKTEYPTPREPSQIPLRVIVSVGSPIIRLSTEVLENILCQLHSVSDYVSLSRTCTRLYNTLQNAQQMSYVFGMMARIPSRCLFWVRPLAEEFDGHGKHGGLNCAASRLRAVKEWCPKEVIGGDMEAGPGAGDPIVEVMKAFDDPRFEWIPFVKACHMSDAMRNRRRIWYQVKQLEAMWVDYRLNGWQVNRFITRDQGIRSKRRFDR